MALPERGTPEWHQMEARVQDTFQLSCMRFLGQDVPQVTAVFHDNPTGLKFISIVERTTGVGGVTVSHQKVTGVMQEGMTLPQLISHIINDKTGPLVCDSHTLEELRAELPLNMVDGGRYTFEEDSRKLEILISDVEEKENFGPGTKVTGPPDK